MSESPEVQIARLEERLKSLVLLLEKEEDNRMDMHQWMGSVDRTLAQMGGRIENVEKSLASSAPTINEFMVLKHKVVGAGVLGKALWVSSAALIGFLYGTKEHVIALFSRGGQ